MGAPAMTYAATKLCFKCLMATERIDIDAQIKIF